VTNPCAVEWCDRPVGDGHVCQRCCDRLSVALGDVGALWVELDLVLTRQARYSDPEGRGGDKALPFNPTASELGWVLRNTLGTWCRLIAEERGRILPTTDTPAAVAGWLLHHTGWLRHHRAGAEAVEEITSAVDQIRKAIDRPPGRWFAGPCDECERDLYALDGAASVHCRDCDLIYDVGARREWLLEQANDQLATAAELARAVSWLGTEPLTAERVRKWAERKRIVAKGHANHRGNQIPTYLVRDAIELMAQDARPKAG
jgi:hypothetical protein